MHRPGTPVRFGLRRRGALTVEIALTLPILLLVLFASYEIARANMLHHAAENAAYEAARAGIIPGATAARCEQQAGSVLRSMGIRDFSVRVTPGAIRRDTPTVGVEVRIPLRGNTTFAPMFFSSTTFAGHCELGREAF